MKKWIAAARLRTLPLAVGGLVIAACIATRQDAFNWTIFWLNTSVALLLQILSNFANDYGDYTSGVDKDFREDRALASGAIQPRTMMRVIIGTALLTFVLGVMLIRVAVHDLSWTFLAWILLGIAAIAAALKYTMGKNPYGYSGKGDIMVFVFFGLVLVYGSSLLYSSSMNWDLAFNLIPAVGYGALSVAVLNINNIRDIDEDKASGKITLAVKLGKKAAINYQAFLYSIGLAAFLLDLAMWSAYLGLVVMIVVAILLFVNYRKLVKGPQDRNEYNALLKQTVLLALMVSFAYFAQLFW